MHYHPPTQSDLGTAAHANKFHHGEMSIQKLVRIMVYKRVDKE